MASDEEVDTTRTSVKTFVPAYQKDEWKRHADELDMSQSEFVRTMVQAGRRDFDLEPVEASAVSSDADREGDATATTGTTETLDATDESGADATAESGADAISDDTTRGDTTTGDTTPGDDLDHHVLSVLSPSDYLSWDELLDELTDSIEDRLEETLQRLQRDNRVQYSGRHGGYTLLAGNDGD